VDGKEHYDRALAIYDPAEHGPLTTRSGRDVGVTLLSFRSSCVWQLGYTAASRSDAELAVKNARETGHATTLMYALFHLVVNHMSTPEQKCIGWPEQKYISDVSRKAPETGVFCSGIRLGSDYLPTYPR
jgi:hypothetical protein